MPLLLSILKLLNIRKGFQLFVPFLNKYWKVVVFLGAIGIIWYQNVWDGPEFLLGLDTIPNKNESIVKIDQKLQRSEKYNTELEQSINKTNIFINEWKKATDKIEHENKMLQQEIAKIKKNVRDKVNTTLSDKTPETCEEAFKYLQKSINDISW